MNLQHLNSVSQDSPYLRCYREGFRLLRFDGELEHAFNRYHTGIFLPRMRGALLVAMLLMLLFGVLDAVSLPDSVRGRTMALRLGVILPILFLTWWATFRTQLHRHLQLIASFCALSSGLGVAGIIWVSRREAFPLPYEGIILVTVFFYFLIGLRFFAAVSCGWLVFFAYLLVEVIAARPGEVPLYNILFLATANVIGSVGCYFLEYGSRENFIAQGLLQDLAEKDFLTGLLNRRAFTERAECSWRQALRERRALAVVMMDVDFFKRYNDQYGHIAGDAALRAIAQVIGRHARRPLDDTGRFGGEEFIGLWYGLEEQKILTILESIRSEIQALNLPHADSEVASVVTLSIGLAYVLPDPRQGLEDILRRADAALYLAKQQGRNRVVSMPAEGPQG